jgi:hypothetical protein
MARSAPTLHAGDAWVLHAGDALPLPPDWRIWLDLLPDDLRDAYEERAALIEYDGGEKRRTAERRAFECVIWRDLRARTFLQGCCAQVLAGAGA